jgi:hypothetical protein
MTFVRPSVSPRDLPNDAAGASGPTPADKFAGTHGGQRDYLYQGESGRAVAGQRSQFGVHAWGRRNVIGRNVFASPRLTPFRTQAWALGPTWRSS